VLGAVREALQPRQVVEHVLGVDLGIDAEVLRQVAEDTAHAGLVAQHVDVRAAAGIDELRRAMVGVLQRGQGSHQGRLAGAVLAEQAEHAGGNRQAHLVERAHAVGVGLGETSDVQFHGRECRAARPGGPSTLRRADDFEGQAESGAGFSSTATTIICSRSLPL